MSKGSAERWEGHVPAADWFRLAELRVWQRVVGWSWGSRPGRGDRSKQGFSMSNKSYMERFNGMKSS